MKAKSITATTARTVIAAFLAAAAFAATSVPASAAPGTHQKVAQGADAHPLGIWGAGMVVRDARQ